MDIESISKKINAIKSLRQVQMVLYATIGSGKVSEESNALLRTEADDIEKKICKYEASIRRLCQP